MTPINYHPTDDALSKYVAGQYDTAFSLVLATHVSQCVKCQNTVALQQEVSGAALSEAKPVKMEMGALDLLERAETETRPIENVKTMIPKVRSKIFGIDVPAILSRYLDGDLDSIKWQRLSPSLKQHILLVNGKASARLLWMAPGKAVPAHGHSGEEMTMILSGGYYDGDEAYTQGDLHFADHKTPHVPVAMDDGPCLVISALDSPLIFSNAIPKLLQPFFKM